MPSREAERAKERARDRRRRVFVWFLVVFLAVGVVAAACAVAFVFLGKQGTERGTILELKLAGEMREAPHSDPLSELGLGPKAISLWDLRRALRHAADDENIAGLFVEVAEPQMGFAQLHEVTEEIRRFGTKKPVHVLLESDFVGDGGYYASTAGTKIWATPAAFWAVNGLSADVEFFKGTLDKLHIEPHYIMMKEYKNAGEPFSRYEMSDYFREAITDVVGDIQGEWYRDVATRRKVDESKIRLAVARGLMTSAQAQETGLVDALGYRDEVEEALRQVAGTEEYESMDLAKYAKDVEDGGSGNAIAIVFGEGPVVAGTGKDDPFGGATLYGPDVAEAIEDATDDDNVKAIVFRVNSPGGSAVGSDVVWRAIEQAQAAGKPVVVSMGSVAGSGGYWVAMGSDAIVAEPSTITGSIGVVFGKMNVRGFFEWIGIHVDSITFAENADIMSPFTGFDDADKARTTEVIEALYEMFKAKVAEGRHIEVEKVETIAKGRIWSGIDAKELGLIDEIGGLDTAIALAATKAGVPGDTRLVLYPEPKSFIEQLLEEELDPGASIELDPAALQAFAIDMAEPRAWAWMPEITLR